MLPVGMEIMSFFGGRGGDSFTDIHGNFIGVPSVQKKYLLGSHGLATLIFLKPDKKNWKGTN